MKKVIWKYTFDGLPSSIFKIPKDSKFLNVQNQAGNICLWFLVDPQNEKEEREFWGALTGLEGKAQNEGVYLGTVQIGDFVAHIFEAKL